MLEYFWGRVFEGIWEYWVNTKSIHISTSFEDENTGEVNKALLGASKLGEIGPRREFRMRLPSASSLQWFFSPAPPFQIIYCFARPFQTCKFDQICFIEKKKFATPSDRK
jgi:hypothetical protein